VPARHCVSCGSGSVVPVQSTQIMSQMIFCPDTSHTVLGTEDAPTSSTAASPSTQ